LNQRKRFSPDMKKNVLMNLSLIHRYPKLYLVRKLKKDVNLHRRKNRNPTDSGYLPPEPRGKLKAGHVRRDRELIAEQNKDTEHPEQDLTAGLKAGLDHRGRELITGLKAGHARRDRELITGLKAGHARRDRELITGLKAGHARRDRELIIKQAV